MDNSDRFRALKGQAVDEAEAKRLFLKAYPCFRISHTKYDYIERKWYVWGTRKEGRGLDKVITTQKLTYHVL